jgi:hypothetical protein
LVTGFDKEYGFERNKPFYIVSKLPMERVLECWHGGNLHLADFSVSKWKQFYFDGVSKTIKSQ